jgi:hypothetical protein
MGFLLCFFFFCRVSIPFSNQIVGKEFDCVDPAVVDEEEGVVEDDGIAIEKKT